MRNRLGLHIPLFLPDRGASSALGTLCAFIVALCLISCSRRLNSLVFTRLIQAWFSDPSTYPLLFCLAVAGSFIVGMTVNAFTYYKDIKINPTNKQKIVRDWGNQPQRTVTQSFAGQHYHTKPEGLGIDHAEWAKKKSAAEN